MLDNSLQKLSRSAKNANKLVKHVGRALKSDLFYDEWKMVIKAKNPSENVVRYNGARWWIVIYAMRQIRDNLDSLKEIASRLKNSKYKKTLGKIVKMLDSDDKMKGIKKQLVHVTCYGEELCGVGNILEGDGFLILRAYDLLSKLKKNISKSILKTKIEAFGVVYDENLYKISHEVNFLL